MHRKINRKLSTTSRDSEIDLSTMEEIESRFAYFSTQANSDLIVKAREYSPKTPVSAKQQKLKTFVDKYTMVSPVGMYFARDQGP
jgi:hypothetical protein